jgi:glycosyltransferase involved in cell wall biosynthesis
VREEPYRGHSAYQTLRCLARFAGVQVFTPQARYPSFLLPRSRSWSQTDLSYSPPDVSATYFDYPALPVLSRPVNGLMIANRLEPLIREYAPDVILSYWIYPDGYAALRVGRKLGIPVVVTAIGSDLNCLHRGLGRMCAKTTLKQADRVLTVSYALRQRAIALGAEPSRSLAILNGCDASTFRPLPQEECRRAVGIEPHARLVLIVGRYDVLKGVIELVKSCAELAPRFPLLQLAMVGEGPARVAIERTAAECGFSDRLHLVGPCPSSRVAQWINACDVFALPSYNEGCPNVLVEALSCGRPVVASRVGGIPELVTQENGILVPPRNLDALAVGLAEALSRPWSATKIAEGSRRSWDDVANEVYAVCESLVKTTDKRRDPMADTD